MLRSFIILLFTATTAAAGPWPRGEGRSFLSYNISSKHDRTGTHHMDYNSVYAEYGLTKDLTAGLDIGFDGGQVDKIHAFIRFPPYQLGSNWLWASDVGLGASDHGHPTFRSNFTFGREIDCKCLKGWFTIDMRAYLVAKKSHSWLESEATFGVNLNKSFKALFQWKEEYDVEDKHASHASTSLVWEFYPGQHIELGATFGVINAGGQRAKIGFWHNF